MYSLYQWFGSCICFDGGIDCTSSQEMSLELYICLGIPYCKILKSLRAPDITSTLSIFHKSILLSHTLQEHRERGENIPRCNWLLSCCWRYQAWCSLLAPPDSHNRCICKDDMAATRIQRRGNELRQKTCTSALGEERRSLSLSLVQDGGWEVSRAHTSTSQSPPGLDLAMSLPSNIPNHPISATSLSYAFYSDFISSYSQATSTSLYQYPFVRLPQYTHLSSQTLQVVITVLILAASQSLPPKTVGC